MNVHGSSSRANGVGLVLAAAVLWGTTGTSQALAPIGATPASVGALRLALGGSLLLGLTLLRGDWKGGRSWPLVPTAGAALFVAAYQLSFFAAVARTGVAVGTMVAIGSSPVIAGILAIVLRKGFPGTRWLVATILAIIGCTLLTGAGGEVRVNLTGILLALCAGASYSLYTLAIKEILPDRHPDTVMAAVFCGGALLLSPLLFASQLSWLLEPTGLLVALHLGAIATALSYSLFSRGLATIPVATAVTLSLAEPLTASLLGITVLGEKLTLGGISGMVLLFAGLGLLALQPRHVWRN